MGAPPADVGLLDLQVNGFAGVDFNDAEALSADALDHALEAVLRTGVTVCLPTVITAHALDLEARLGALDRAVAGSRLGPAMVPGFHLEGPFLNPAPGFAGCHPPEAMREPEIDLLERLEGGLRRPILLVTLAPELPGGVELVRRLAGRGKLVAIGHSDPDAATLRAAVKAGAKLSTHLGNALPAALPKLDNPLFRQLAEDAVTATFIADGIHVPPFALKAMLRAKGPGRAVLVTDAVAAAAAPAGLHRFAGMIVERTAEGAVRLPGTERLAGSALRLDEAVRNLVAWGVADGPEALAMAGAVPRRLLAPALAAHGIGMADAEVRWDAGLRPVAARAGDFSVGGARRFG